MRCPYCASSETRVVDSRSAEDGGAVRRRRTCQGCGQRFSTYERAEQLALTVAKRDGSPEPFDRDKILGGIAKATANLDVDGDTVRRTLARVEGRIRTLARREVASETIGAEVLEALRELHPVAALRFASVYKGFTSPEDFRRELARLDLDGSGVSLDEPQMPSAAPTPDAREATGPHSDEGTGPGR